MTDSSNDRYEQLVDRFEELQARRDDVEKNQAYRLFYRRGGTDDELMKDLPSQKLLLAFDDTTLDDARAIESDIDEALSKLERITEEGKNFPLGSLDNVESHIDSLEGILDAADGLDSSDNEDEESLYF